VVEQATRISVIGAGVMGAGIAQVAATFGYPTCCHDISAEALTRARSVIEDGRFGLRRGVVRGKLTEQQAEAALARLSFTDSLSRAADADVVIEAVYDDLGLKMRVFRDLDAASPPHAVLASNTSGLPIVALATVTRRPEQVLGWHWASPVPVQPLAELVVTPETSPVAIETIRAIARTCGKNPIVVKDDPTSWGFVANRILMAAMREAERIVELEIAKPAEVDQLLQDCFSWPAGILGMRDRTANGWSDPA
jgi:3-hydroxybutyryl-CoA dehydrogenase